MNEAVHGRTAVPAGAGDGLEWRRASFCGSAGCLELAATADGVAVRDSKDPDGPVLRYGRGEFAAWVAAAKAGEFDDLCGG